RSRPRDAAGDGPPRTRLLRFDALPPRQGTTHMNRSAPEPGHAAQHARASRSAFLRPPASDLIRVGSRRWFLQTGLAGMAGLSLPALLRCQARAAASDRRAVILIWLSGGPSHLDTWDMKPDAPVEIRGPFQTIATRVPGVRLSEHLPRLAALADRQAI